MPFRSRSQVRACYARAGQAKREGKESTWDCNKWWSETSKTYAELPEVASRRQSVSRRRSSSRRSNRKVSVRRK